MRSSGVPTVPPAWDLYGCVGVFCPTNDSHGRKDLVWLRSPGPAAALGLSRALGYLRVVWVSPRHWVVLCAVHLHTVGARDSRPHKLTTDRWLSTTLWWYQLPISIADYGEQSQQDPSARNGGC